MSFSLKHDLWWPAYSFQKAFLILHYHLVKARKHLSGISAENRNFVVHPLSGSLNYQRLLTLAVGRFFSAQKVQLSSRQGRRRNENIFFHSPVKRWARYSFRVLLSLSRSRADWFRGYPPCWADTNSAHLHLWIIKRGRWNLIINCISFSK